MKRARWHSWTCDVTPLDLHRRLRDVGEPEAARLLALSSLDLVDEAMPLLDALVAAIERREREIRRLARGRSE